MKYTLPRPEEVAAYLKWKGFGQVSSKRSDVYIFRREGDLRQDFIFPMKLEFADYAMRFNEIAEFFSGEENLAVAEIVDQVLFTSSDLIKFRIANDDTKAGTILLSKGLEFLASTKKALLATACGVLDKRRTFARMTNPVAESFIKACRLGQTEKGSFVSNIICPINAVVDQGYNEATDLFPQIPGETFTRRVTKSFLQSTRFLVQALEANDLNRVIQPGESDPMVSSNLCDALAMMRPDGNEGLLEVRLIGAPSAPKLGDVSLSVVLRSQLFDAVEQVSSQLKKVEEPRIGQYFGRVSSVTRDAENDLIDGEVIISVEHDEKIRKVKVPLKPEDFLKACDAIKSGMPVIVTGTLLLGPKVSRIENYSDFRPLK